MDIERLPPYSLEAEQATLGAMLLDREAIITGIEMLDPDDYYRDSNRLVFTAIKELEQEGRSVDLVTVTDVLRRKDALDRCGGMAYLATLANAVPSSAGISNYASIVKDKSLLRKMIKVTEEYTVRGYEDVDDAGKLLGQLEQSVYQIGRDRASLGLAHISELLPSMVNQIESLSQRAEGITGLPSGYTALDRFTGGWQKSDLIIIASRPSMGKTALGLNLAENAAMRYRAPVAIFSLEMSRESLLLRLISSRTNIEQTALRNGSLRGDEWLRLADAASELSKAPIYIDDNPLISVSEVRSRARRMKSEMDLQLIVIDYLQFMQGDHRGSRSGDNRQQEIADISRSLKALARELEIPIIVMAQLNREVERGTGNRRPGLSHLRESGSLEQDADLVMFIYRDEYYNEDTEDKGIAEIIIGKHRNGPTGTVKLGFEDIYTRFFNLREAQS